VDDGYYVKLDSLKAGTHTLRIPAAATGNPPFSLDVKYILIILPVSNK
jgi:hypothetical protein